MDVNLNDVEKYAMEFDQVVTNNIKNFLRDPNIDKYQKRQIELANAALVVYVQTLFNGLAGYPKKEASKMLREFNQMQNRLMTVRNLGSYSTNLKELVEKSQ